MAVNEIDRFPCSDLSRYRRSGLSLGRSEKTSRIYFDKRTYRSIERLTCRKYLESRAMSKEAPERPDPVMEDTFAECFGEHVNATQMDQSADICTEGPSRNTLLNTQAALRVSETQTGGERGGSQHSNRHSSAQHPTVSGTTPQTEQEAIPTGGPDAPQQQYVAGMEAKTISHPDIYILVHA